MREARSRHHRAGSRQTRSPDSPVRAFASPRQAAAKTEPVPTSACPRAMTTPLLVAGGSITRLGQREVGGLRVSESGRLNRGPLTMSLCVGGPPLTAPPLRPGVSHRRAHSLSSPSSEASTQKVAWYFGCVILVCVGVLIWANDRRVGNRLIFAVVNSIASMTNPT